MCQELKKRPKNASFLTLFWPSLVLAKFDHHQNKQKDKTLCYLCKSTGWNLYLFLLLLPRGPKCKNYSDYSL